MEDEYPSDGAAGGEGTSGGKGEDRENVMGGDSLVKWCQTLQERAIRRELETEKFGITNRERTYFRKIFGYSDGEKKKKNLSDAGGYTIEALNLHKEMGVETTQHDKETSAIQSAIQISDDHQQGKNQLGSLPSIFSQVRLNGRPLNDGCWVTVVE